MAPRPLLPPLAASKARITGAALRSTIVNPPPPPPTASVQAPLLSLPPPPPLPATGPLPPRMFAPAVITPPPPPPAPVEVTPMPVAPASPTGSSSASSEDLLAELMASEQFEDLCWPLRGMDPMAAEFDTYCTKVVASPLSFPTSSDVAPVSEKPGLGSAGTFSPSPLRLPSPAGGGRAPATNDAPIHASTDMIVPDLAAPDDVAATDGVIRALFAVPPSSLLGASPPPRPQPAKELSAATPRHSAHQAGKPSSTPVAQRATIRLAKELAVIDADDPRPDTAAAALLQRFKEPLSTVDVDGLAVLTRIDRDALHRAAGQASTTSAASQAT
ncbi:proline-rich receptor-like protein kinase PERK2 [Brachypodium distachyon]|nr:proline-rich receptor-like protein kinase PERK2 [Brachypodium distachyon]|eukprot:XP_010233448.1 proline-rich receptor-like protein kinase PERK2 [Brachypodium distachyon]